VQGKRVWQYFVAMPRATPLSRERILTAAEKLVAQTGPESLTLRKLGDALGVNNTALYRHFRNKEELLLVLGDRIMADVVPGDDAEAGWYQGICTICLNLRRAQMAQPEMGSLVQGGPTREENELRITEALLAHLKAAGLQPQDAATVYHALIELTVGSAAIDAQIARLGEEERDAVYALWKREYAALDPERFPATPEHARFLYLGDAESRFRDGLEAMLSGYIARYGLTP
jgi:TetR/AcrR family transcriptional regulator, tetracycline repressor protein